jgi:hypothetical protein
MKIETQLAAGHIALYLRNLFKVGATIFNLQRNEIIIF